MRKRNRFLRIVSSIISCLIICGIFCCSIIIRSDKKVEKVVASNTLDNYVNTTLSLDTEYGFKSYTNGNYVRVFTERGTNHYNIFNTSTIVFLNSSVEYEYKLIVPGLVNNFTVYLDYDTFGNNIIRLDGGSNRDFIRSSDDTYTIKFKVPSDLSLNVGTHVINCFLRAGYSLPTSFDYYFYATEQLSTKFVNFGSEQNLSNVLSENSTLKVSYNVNYFVNSVAYKNIYFWLSKSNNGNLYEYSCVMITGDLYNYPYNTETFVANNGRVVVSSNFDFVDGADIDNSQFKLILGSLFTFVGYNNYTIGVTTQEQYLQTIYDLQNQVNTLNQENEQLSLQVSTLESQVSTQYDLGYSDGVLSQESVVSNAYSLGYSDGYSAADNQDQAAATIFSGILQVAMVPVNFFLAIFNFEILGINISAFIRAIFTVVLTIIVLKTVLGKGGGSSDN